MLMVPEEGKNFWEWKFTTSGILILTVLIAALIALGERILYDIGRTFVAGPLDYFDNLALIVVHAFFIIPVLAISIFVNVTLSIKDQKYGVILIPYFVFSAFLALQLALQIAVYFGHHHNRMQLYIALVALAGVCTYGIYYVQSKFNPEK